MSKKYPFQLIVRAVLICALTGIYNTGFAGGFQLHEQNVTNLGTAYAGTAALAEDASTNFYNAAGLVRLCNEQIVFSGVWTFPNIKIIPTNVTTTFNGSAVGINNQVFPSTSRTNSSALVPAIHYFRRLSDNWAFGLSAVSSFGLKLDYGTNSSIRYLSSRTDLRTYDIAPSLAYCFGNGLSIGAGLDVIYAILRFDAQLGLFSNPNAFTNSTDGFRSVTIDRWALGGHVGAMWQLSECTRIGANYRSQAKLRLHGQDLESRPAVLAFIPRVGLRLIPTGTPTEQGVRGNSRLPDVAVFSLYHQFNNCWALMGDVEWVHWKTIQRLTLNFDDNSTQAVDLNFKDTWRVALGSSYQWDECLRLRLGVAYDESPVKNQFRTVLLPDSDRWWLGVGAQYRFSPCLAMDIGYAHLFFKNVDIHQGPPIVTPVTALGPVSQRVDGRVKSRADLVGIQLTWDLV